MADEIFGPLISFNDVEEALIGHIQLWARTYINARERKMGIAVNTIPFPRSWFTRQTFDALPGEESTPFVVIVSAGTPEIPFRHGDGHYDVILDVAVAVVVEASEADAARELGGHYQAALLPLLLQQSGFSVGTDTAKIDEWTGMSMDDIPDEAARTLFDVELRFNVKYRGFADDSIGPTTPPVDPEDPQPGYGTVRPGGVFIEVQKGDL